MEVKIKKIEPQKERRVIVISDIHGNLSLFKKLLRQVSFCMDDILVLLGDIVEKGSESINTLRYVMELSKEYTVHVVCGNCDDICLALLSDRENEALLNYIIVRENSLIGEMCRQQGIEITRELDMLSTKRKLAACYKEEIDWIAGLPHIIEMGNYVFSHASAFADMSEGVTANQIMKFDDFMNSGQKFDRYHVVGHWPVELYSTQIRNCNPRFDHESKIISIDGGNVLNKDGQLNALILKDAYTEAFTYCYADDLPMARAASNQEASNQSFNIRWIDNKVTIIKKEDDLSYCSQDSTGYEMWIPDSHLYECKDGWHTNVISDYKIGVKEGDILSVSEKTKRGFLVKKDGICGWYYGKLDNIKQSEGVKDDQR